MYRGDSKMHPRSKQAAETIVTRVSGLPESGSDIDRYLDGPHFEALPGTHDPSITRLWRIGKWVLAAIIIAGPASAIALDIKSFKDSSLCLAWIVTFILATFALGVSIFLRKRHSRQAYFESLRGLVESSSEASLKFFFNGIWQDGVEVGPGALLREEKHWNDPDHPLNRLLGHRQYSDPISESPYNHDDSDDYPTNRQVQTALRAAKAAVTEALKEQRLYAGALIEAVGWLERSNEIDLETRKSIAEQVEERLGHVSHTLRRFFFDLQNATSEYGLDRINVANHKAIYDTLIAFVKEDAVVRVETVAPLQASGEPSEKTPDTFDTSLEPEVTPLTATADKTSS